jgi:hypothetical protein
VYLTLLFFPCYSNLLLRRRGWTRILRWGVLGYVLPRLSFLWCYGVFRCSVLLRVIIVFRDTIYVIIIILYSWHLIICKPFRPYVWNNWSWVMHTMSTWFWHKNQVWQWSLTIFNHMCSVSFSSIHYDLHALIGLPKPYTFRIWVHTRLVMLSHAIISVVQVFHFYDVEFGLC